jgi:hypothetical protein
MNGRSQSELLPDALAAVSARPEVPSWLISALVHLVALLVLAFSMTRPQRGVRRGIALLAGIAAHEAEAGVETPAMTIASAGGGAVDILSAAAGSSGGVRTLADALAGGRPVDPTNALPAAVAVGAGGLEGGVGSATGAAGGSKNGPGGDRALGGKARTGVFGAEAEGYKFVYVFDRSASMGGTGQNALQAAKAELLASLEKLERTHQFQIIFYNEQVFKFSPSGDPDRLIFASDDNKAAAKAFVRTITPDDGTDHEKALVAAIKLRPDAIFFLTDADEPKLWPAQLAKVHRMAGGITIHAIEFGSGPQLDADNFLVRLARQNGGQHVYVDISRILTAAKN